MYQSSASTVLFFLYYMMEFFTDTAVTRINVYMLTLPQFNRFHHKCLISQSSYICVPLIHVPGNVKWWKWNKRIESKKKKNIFLISCLNRFRYIFPKKNTIFVHFYGDTFRASFFDLKNSIICQNNGDLDPLKGFDINFFRSNHPLIFLNLS